MAITGAFYFQKTASGNLVGEFTNDHDAMVRAECSVQHNTSNGFVGSYETIWDDGTLTKAQLLISQQNSPKFNLQWIVAGNVRFTGQGFICNSLLIGFYKD